MPKYSDVKGLVKLAVALADSNFESLDLGCNYLPIEVVKILADSMEKTENTE